MIQIQDMYYQYQTQWNFSEDLQEKQTPNNMLQGQGWGELFGGLSMAVGAGRCPAGGAVA